MATVNQLTKKQTNNVNLTHLFIKSSSKTIWHSYIQILTDLHDQDKIKEILNIFCTQIIQEEQFYKDGEYNKLSDCSLQIPRLDSTLDKKHLPIRMAHYCADKIFIDTERTTDKLYAKIQYTQLISKIAKAYINEQIKEATIKAEYKTNRILEHQRHNWCSLKNREIREAVGKPTAMKVEIAPLNELADFFHHLQIDGDITKYPHTEFKRGAVYPDGRMDLCKQVVGPTWIGNLMESLKTNTHIEHFLLGNNITGEEGGSAIRDFLLDPHLCHIKTWYIAGSEFNSNAIGHIVDGLIEDSDTEALWLKRNPIYAEGMIHIRRLLENHTKIHILDLHNCAIGLTEKAYSDESKYYEKYLTNDGLFQLCEGLKMNNSLRHLYLDCNALTTKSMNFLRDYFEFKLINKSDGIHSLWLDMNKLGDDGLEILIPTFKNYMIKRLNVGSTMMTEKGCKIICDTFMNHPFIQVLDMSLYKSTADMGEIPNNMSDLAVSSLCELIEQNQSLLYLNVSMNNISEDGINKLADSLEKNNNILFFYYKQYGININQQIIQKINFILNRNIQKYQQMHQVVVDTEFARTLKHSYRVKNIDSIYRNSMK